MAGNPRIVTENTVFQWDGVSQRLAKGQLIDVAAGSALEQAIGADRLIPLNGPPAVAPQAVPENPAQDAPPDAAPDGAQSVRKTARTAAKTAGDSSSSSDDTDGAVP